MPSPGQAESGSSSLVNHVCLVTGASRGIGRGVAVSLGRCGAVVYITGRTLGEVDDTPDKSTLLATAKAITEAGGVSSQ
ncbi:unnamed protein product [Echinostoma caproni]|uniref:SDR family NAD(P)-dependent oxidoreductase n=1 Tax=Echinostoma caproni TaxID=27848 RepID=A0A183AVB0_9TREM|nr:unnamed protein product [Echinostoma caproni]